MLSPSCICEQRNMKTPKGQTSRCSPFALAIGKLPIVFARHLLSFRQIRSGYKST